MIGGRRPLPAASPATSGSGSNAHAPYFRYTGPGQLTAKAAASAPTTPGGVIRVRVKGVLLGRPLASEEEIGERLSKKKALAIFSSDAISSSAYATEEILLAFVLAGVAAGGVQPLGAGRDRDRRPARDRRVQLPPGVHRLPHRRRLVLGVQGQLRPDGLAGGRVGAAHRLHLTVAVSTSSAVEQIVVGGPGARSDPGRDRRSAPSCSSRSATSAACARPATSSRSRPTCSSARRSS